MSEEEEAPPPPESRFSEDPRAKFVGQKVVQVLRVRAELWDRFCSEEQNQNLLSDFFENPVRLMIFSASSVLTAATEVCSLPGSRCLYVLKKENVPVLSENCRNVLLFGLLSPSLLTQLSNSVDKVCLPLLSNKKNHLTWPSAISQDVTRHVETLSSKVTVVNGQIHGRTVLPVTAVTERLERRPAADVRLQDCHDGRTVMHAIESMVINWTHLIQKVLKEDSAELILKGLNPGPSAELHFWRSRKRNIQNIYDQIQSPEIQKMVRILEAADSSYFPSFKALTEEVSDALQKARDVDLHLQQLQPLLFHVEEVEFPSLHPLIRPLFHLVFLVWTHCSSYRAPARIVVLLQELCNLIIQQASSYLRAEELLRGDTEETLEKLQVVLKLLTCFKESFHAYRGRVSVWAGTGGVNSCWDFPSALVFTRFDSFLARVLLLEDLFSAMLELQKLEKLIFGGVKGRTFTEQVSLLLSEFQQLCKGITDKDYDPLDLTSQAVLGSERCLWFSLSRSLRRTVSSSERRWQVTTGGSGISSALRVETVQDWSQFTRGLVKDSFTPSLARLVRLFGDELESCKRLFDLQLQQRRRGQALLCKNMSAMSGALKWAKMLRARIQAPWENFRLVLDVFTEGAAVELVQHQYREMSTLLDEFEEEVYSDWCGNVEQICQLNLDQPLIRRDSDTGLLSVNFNQELLAILRDVRHLQMLERVDIPSAAMEVYERRDSFLTCISSLQLLVQAYNKVRQTAVDVEVSLMTADLVAIDQQLHRAETELTWQHQGCWSYISQVMDRVCRLERRIQRAKDNVEMIQELMKGWSKQPMFCRKDSKKDTLLMLEDRAGRVAKRYSSVRRDGETIHRLLQENRDLFGAEGGSEAWQDYVEYVDEMVVEGFFSAVSHSLEFFVDNMEVSVRRSPLLEAQIELSSSEIVFRPSMDPHAGDGFYELVEGLLADVFKMSAQVKRVAPHLDMEDYQDDMDDMLDLLDLRQEVMERVSDVVRRVSQYRSTFERYSHLWLDERAEFLRQFLLYGQSLTAEDVEAYGEDALPEAPPTTDQFKQQIDHYEELYVEVGRLEDGRVFEGWFKVDTRPFKMSLLNTIKKWSWMFKEHLVSYVTDNVAELEEFIVRADSGLREPVRGGDRQALLQVMGCLLAIRDRQSSTDQLFEPLRAVVSLLEQYGEALPENIYLQLEELPERWSSVKKLAWTVKHEVAPLQNTEVAVIRRKYGAFEVKLSQFEERFRTEAPLQYSAENPYSQLDKCYSELVTLELELAELQESCKLFEVSSPDFRQLRQWRREISTLKQLWDLLLCAQSRIAGWALTAWREINVDEMDAELRRFAKEMQVLDKEARGWAVFMGLDCRLRDLLTSLRAVAELQNRAMRDRHWTQLVKATGVDLTLTERTTLADLLALQLHMYEEEVHSTVARAVKEMAIEKLLGEISQTWALMEFAYEEHFRTCTPLLKCDDELIERLEEHQVQLQVMSQMKQVEFFHGQVQVLQTRLAQAESVLMLWLEVQRSWAHLESVFMGSDDIQHQLPADTLQFHSINSDFKDLMFKSSETKNVISATNRPHLLETLEDLQMRFAKKLAVCEKALAKYLESKRIAFPRFYFISSADLLDILSKGSQPKQTAVFISLRC
ncbi:hypothetical protein MHYP_G00033920 [Metynnis hypsauchen]